MKKRISFILNGQQHTVAVDTRELLVDFLRETLYLTGTKVGCGIGECGACTVLLDGEPVNACLVLAASIDGGNIVTVEGLRGEEAEVLQRAFIEEGAVQCGYCTPGMLLSAKAVLDRNRRPSETEVRQAVSGNLCRCTGYERIVRAVMRAAGDMEEREEPVAGCG
jgi:aerobic-type carbon monoxide dehydrogenase small subunit (CoxS/CutS family)